MDEKILQELLWKENQEYRQAFEKHRLLDSELETLQGKKFPSEDEKMRIKELKKKKLVYKDRLYQILADYKESLRKNS